MQLARAFASYAEGLVFESWLLGDDYFKRVSCVNVNVTTKETSLLNSNDCQV